MQTPMNSGIVIKEQAPIRSGLVIKEQIPIKPSIVIKEQTPIQSGIIIKEQGPLADSIKVKEQILVTSVAVKDKETKEQYPHKSYDIKNEAHINNPSVKKKKWILPAIISCVIVLMLALLKVFNLFPDISAMLEDIRGTNKQVIMADKQKPEAAPSPVQSSDVTKIEETDPAIYKEEIRNMINKWLASWQSGDMKNYRNCYDETYFESKGMNLDAWVAHKENVNKKNKNINISIDNLQISADENIATAIFTQHYVSSALKDSGEKTLELRKVNNEWKIYREVSLSNGASVFSFEKGLSNEQKVAAVLITNAIRSGNEKELSKYTRSEEDAKNIITWWHGADELSNIRFRVRAVESKMFIQDNSSGMYTCDIKKDENRFIITPEDCIFNDGY